MRIRTQHRAIVERVHGYLARAGRFARAGRLQRHVNRAGNMARAILARYAAMDRRWPMMALLFEQSDRTSPSVTHTYLTTHSSLFMQPRTLLRLLLPQPATNPRIAAARTPAQQVGITVIPMAVAASARRQPRHSEQDDVILRLVGREVREEYPSQGDGRPARRPASRTEQATPSQDPAISRRSPSLLRTYRRVVHSQEEAAVVTAAPRAPREPSSARERQDMEAAVPGRSPIDIARITDQVLHALDRRIVAQRERMGMN